MPDPVFTWTIFAIVWGCVLARGAYQKGWRDGNAADRREAPAPVVKKKRRRRAAVEDPS